MKKRLLLIIEAMSGGAGRHVHDLIMDLNLEELDVYVIYSPERTDTKFLNNLHEHKKQVKLIVCDSLTREINLMQDLHTYQFISKIIKEIQPDIVHCHSSKAGVIGRIAAKKNKITKIFYTPHAYSFLAPEFSINKKKIFINIEKMLSRFATTKTFCVSNGEKNSALKNSLDKENKFEVIYNGLPEIELQSKEKLKIQLGLKPTDFVIGNIARLSKQKNPMLFIEIAKNVISKEPSAHFVWIGDGPLYEQCYQYININKLDKNIHFLGYKNNSEILVKAYDVFLSTSLYEGLPYSLIEALRAGVPIFVSNVVGHSEFFKNKRIGYLYALSDSEYISRMIIQFARKKDEFDSYLIMEEFNENYSITNMMRLLQKNYQSE